MPLQYTKLRNTVLLGLLAMITHTPVSPVDQRTIVRHLNQFKESVGEESKVVAAIELFIRWMENTPLPSDVTHPEAMYNLGKAELDDPFAHSEDNQEMDDPLEDTRRIIRKNKRIQFFHNAQCAILIIIAHWAHVDKLLEKRKTVKRKRIGNSCKRVSKK